MERYLEQLIEELHEITENLNVSSSEEAWQDIEEEMLDFSQVEKYERNEVTPVSEITGIKQEQLPPAEKLNQEQQALLAAELEDLLCYFHFRLVFPNDYPYHLRYPFIRQLWSEEQVSVSSGTIHIEFCEYEEEKCPFPGYCKLCFEDEWKMKDHQEDHKNNAAFKGEDYLFEEDEDTPYSENINGFYDDDGNKIDLTTVPVPGLCLSCWSNQVDDWDGNLLCLMNRNDQRNNTEFICGAYQKI